MSKTQTQHEKASGAPEAPQHSPLPWWSVDQMLKEDGSVLNQCGRSVCRHCGKQGEEAAAIIQIIAGRDHKAEWGVAQLGSYDPKSEHAQHLANAKFIVRCVSNAERLAEACKQALECHSSNAPIHSVLTEALAAWEGAQ